MPDLSSILVVVIYAVIFAFQLFVGYVWVAVTWPFMYLIWKSKLDFEDILLMSGVTLVWLAITLAWAYWIFYTLI